MTRMQRIFSCCQECDESFEGCRRVCVTYLKAQEEWNELKKTIREAKNKEKLYEHYHRDRVLHQHKVNRNKNGR